MDDIERLTQLYPTRKRDEAAVKGTVDQLVIRPGGMRCVREAGGDFEGTGRCCSPRGRRYDTRIKAEDGAFRDDGVSVAHGCVQSEAGCDVSCRCAWTSKVGQSKEHVVTGWRCPPPGPRHHFSSRLDSRAIVCDLCTEGEKTIWLIWVCRLAPKECASKLLGRLNAVRHVANFAVYLMSHDSL